MALSSSFHKLSLLSYKSRRLPLTSMYLSCMARVLWSELIWWWSVDFLVSISFTITSMSRSCSSWYHRCCSRIVSILLRPTEPLHPGVHQAQPDQLGKRGLSRCIQRWCGLTWSAVCRFGPHSLRRMWGSLIVSQGGQQRWWKGLKDCPMKSSWGLSSCLAWRRGGWGVTSLLSTASWGGDMEREVLSSSSWYPVTGCVGMVQSCTRGGLDWVSGRISLPRGWSDSGTGFLESWSMSQACQRLKGFRTMPLIICFNLVSPELAR